MKNRHSRETSNRGYTRRRQPKQTYNTKRARHHYTKTYNTKRTRHHYTHTNTSNANKSVSQTIERKDEPNITSMRKSERTSQH